LTDKKLIDKITSTLQGRSAKSLKIAKQLILSEKVECKEINEAFKYYAENWYDYIHPGLISIACEAVNGNPDDTVQVQVAMLLLAAAVDLHDDVIDESKTKYGKPTVFGKFGKEIALLVGDAFLIRAFTQLHKLDKQISKKKIDAIWNIINNQIFELGDAEALEASLKSNVNISPEDYLHIINKKVSSLEAHMRIGAIIGNAKQDEIDMLGDYGRTIGTLMIIRDDFIDIYEPEELQNRMKNELLPLPILYAFRNSRVKKSIMSILSEPKISDKDTGKIVGILLDERNVRIFKNKIQNMVKKSSHYLSRLRNKRTILEIQTLVQGLLEDL